jgi:hypothetical protein
MFLYRNATKVWLCCMPRPMNISVANGVSMLCFIKRGANLGIKSNLFRKFYIYLLEFDIKFFTFAPC